MGGAAVFIATSAMLLVRYGKEMCAGQDCMGANPALSYRCHYGWVGQALFVRGQRQTKLRLVSGRLRRAARKAMEAPHVNGSVSAWVGMSA